MRKIHFKNIFLTLFVTGLLFSCSTLRKLQKTPIGLINNVSYTNSEFNNPNAGNGFLVEHQSKTYAITAKHVLMIAKTDAMEFVAFEGGLKQWKMHPKNNESSYVILEELLNSNRKDSLTWDYLDANWDTYNDWLVFSVKENKSKHKPLKFRSTPIIKDESLYVVGWSYKDTIGEQRVYEYKFNQTEGDYHNLTQVNGPISLGGLSGSPLVDEKGNVVGIVSSGWEDEKTKEIILQATSVKNAIEFISKLP